jgi:Zn-dependent protease
MSDRRDSQFRKLRVLGFPVEIRPGFVVFLALVVFLYGGTLGLWAAGTIAVFTLIHELGHASAARATGARAEIALDFLAGYAAYEPSRPLARWERAGIAAAGPLSQFATGVVVLLLLGANPFSRDDIVASEATITVWGAGVVLALVNLIPVLPLDGGAIVSAGLERLAPKRGRQAMLWFSIAVSSGLLTFAVLVSDARGFLPFAVILLVLQFQILSTGRNITPEVLAERGYSPADFVSALQDVGRHQEAAEQGALLFRTQPDAELAALISSSLTAIGDHDGAQAWMRLAEQMSFAKR